ncbi:hypothetical protein BBG47_05615 [Paenibacillus sp. KS1]|uniref:non-ribosomal peptide synthetase n=1 Tax=Paenibacillus sp. KS1 TaxID=1849249 RepID=UPI0008066689|nr:non-ribosomal peptide synthetase [Paenibacillus sp. KS1]OBY80500.1 hypothetical protein BBG47_05615 [Paenibacillus sp. KS1]
MNDWSLTHPQLRIWYMENMQPNTSLGIISVSLRLKSKQGNLEIPFLQQAVNELLRRNEVLRLRIVERDGQEPRQYISKYQSYEVPVIDAVGIDVQSWEKARAQMPMPWKDTDLFEFILLRINATDCVLYQRFHHFIHDGISQQLIIDDILAYYSCLVQGAILPDSHRPSYLQFIASELEYEQSERREKDRQYWLQEFEAHPSDSAHIISPLQLHDPTCKSNRISYPLSASMQQHVYQFCEKHQVSLFTLFTALLGIYLYKWNGNQNQVIGTTLSNRTNRAEKNMLGMFVSTVPLRLQIEGKQDRISFIKQVNKKQFSAARHQKYPFNQLVQDIRSKTGESSPLFHASIEYRETDTSNVNSNEHVQYEWEHIHCGYEENDFLLRVQRVAATNELSLHFDYQIAKFNSEEIQRQIEQYVYVIEEVLAQPERSIDSTEICTPEQRAELMTSFQAAKTQESNPTLLVVQAFNEQCERTPEAIAIRCDQKSITYRELSTRADRLSAHLRNKGIGQDDVVGILMERSIDTIVSMLGIWRAGAAYIPLDPALPHERISFMLTDSSVKVIVTHRGLERRFHIDRAYEWLDLDKCTADSDKQESRQESQLLNDISKDDIQVTHPAPNSLAYIIYTSGSTGNPKGVMIEHQSFGSTLHYRNKEYKTRVGDTVLPLISFAFDGFVATCWSPLITGATVVLAVEEAMKDFYALRNLIIQEKVYHIISTPSLYGSLLTGLSTEDMSSLRIVTLAGERVSDAVIKRSKQLQSDTEIVIEYGPSENSVVTSIKKDAQAGGAYSIGRPLANSFVYIVNEHLQLQPIGAQGQLCITGIGLARGYLNLPEQSEQRFIASPFFDSDGWKRMYLTGDYARWLPNGELEFIGRTDDQVKIRGYRIEIGEIESQLQRLPGIHEAAVLTVKQGASDSTLSAYIVSDQGLVISDIRTQLLNQLPIYMVPAHFMKIDSMPLTHNGKIDRKALLHMTELSSGNQPYIAPATEREQLLAELWAETLNRHPIGLHHSFWELGGDSIKALQLMGRLHQFGYTLTVKELHSYPTLGEAAARMRFTDKRPQNEIITGVVPFTPIQQWFWEQRFANPHHWNQSFVLFSKTRFVQEHIEHVFDHLVLHHDALRMTYRPEGELTLQTIRQPDEGPFYHLVSYELEDADHPEREMEQIATQLQQSMNLYKGPIVKLGLFRMKGGDHLLLTIHHLLVDGYAWRVLLEDFADGYDQLVNGHPLRVRPKSTSLKQWAERLLTYAQQDEVIQELPYWLALEQYSGDPLPLGIRSDVQAADFGVWSDNGMIAVEFSSEATDILLRSNNTSASPEAYDLMLTAFGMALADWSGGRTFRLDVEGHGREAIGEEIEVSRTIGWFMTMYPIILDMSRADSLPAAVEQTRQMLRSIPNKGMNYGVLKYLTKHESASGTAILERKANINFNYMGQFGNELNNEKFTFSSMPPGDTIGLDNGRMYQLEAVAMIVGRQLVVRFVYSTRDYEHSNIQELVNRYKARLEALLELHKHGYAPGQSSGLTV